MCSRLQTLKQSQYAACLPQCSCGWKKLLLMLQKMYRTRVCVLSISILRYKCHLKYSLTVFAIPEITASDDTVSGFSRNVEMAPPTLQTVANAPGTFLPPFPFYYLCSYHALEGAFCVQKFKCKIFIWILFLVCHRLWEKLFAFRDWRPRIWLSKSVCLLPWTLPGLVLCSSKM